MLSKEDIERLVRFCALHQNKVKSVAKLSSLKFGANLVLEKSNLPWDWLQLCKNVVFANVDEFVAFVELVVAKKSSDNLVFEHLSCNTSITEEMFMKFKDKMWNFDLLIRIVPKLKVIETSIGKVENINGKIDLTYLSSTVSLDDVNACPDIKWDYEILVNRFSDFAQRFKWSNISRLHKYNFPIWIIEENYDKINSFYGLSNCYSLPLFLKTCDKDWNFTEISHEIDFNNPDIQELIVSRPDLEWDWDYICANCSDKDYICAKWWLNDKRQHYNVINLIPKERRNYSKLSSNRRLSARFVYENLDEPWTWQILYNLQRQMSSMKTNLTSEEIDKICVRFLESDVLDTTNDDAKPAFINWYCNLEDKWAFFNTLISDIDIFRRFSDKLNIKSQTSRFPLETIFANVDLNWDWDYLTSIVKCDLIISNPSYNWNWSNFSTRAYLYDKQLIIDNPEFPWDVKSIQTFDEEFVYKYMDITRADLIGTNHIYANQLETLCANDKLDDFIESLFDNEIVVNNNALPLSNNINTDTCKSRYIPKYKTLEIIY